jgi:predicted MFS family arabinose efflux permease
VLPFLTDAVSYLLSVLSLLLITADLRPHTAGRSRDLRTDLLAGPAWLWHEPLIRSLSLLDGAEALVASGSTLVVIVLAKQHHAAPATIGAIFSVAGGGGVLGALLGAHVQARLGFGRTVIGVRWASAMLWPLYAIAPNALFLGMITAGIYVLNPIKNVAHVSYALPLIPEELRGRVTGLWDLIPSATAFAGVTLTGLALQSSGPRATVGVASVIVLMLALAITLNSHVRNAPAPAAARPPE